MMVATSGTGRGLTIVRRFAAPRELVFQAWTDPAHLYWFADTEAPGERQETTVDLRVGGAWRIHMVESANKSYLTGGIYREIVPPERLAFTWGAVDGWPPIDPDRPEDSPVVTVTLKDLGDATEMTFHVGFPDQLSEETVRKWLATGMTEGWNVTLDRLGPSLTRLISSTVEMPRIVPAEEWQRARDELLVAEKEATRALDALAARRRRLPAAAFGAGYTFATPAGPKSLLDLFEGRRQLVVYQFMDRGPDEYCPGCTAFTDNIPAAGPRRLADRGITWVNVSTMPLAQIEAYKAMRGWTVPFVSCRGTTFAEDCDAGTGFMLTTFLRDGDEVYRTYNTTYRGVDRILWVHDILDLTVYGRQEAWEDSPAGWPRGH